MTARSTLITCLKDEGPFLIEWLAFHKAIGFDRVIAGANDCTDGSDQMLARLAEMGEVEYYPFTKPPDQGAQNTFADSLDAADVIRVGNWVCWLDLDEFLNIHLGTGQLSDLIAAMDGADAMRINWRIFGVPEATPWPGRQIHEDLCRCAVPDFGRVGVYRGHRTFKTLFRYTDDMMCTPHTPMIGDAATAKRLRWLNGSGTEVRHPVWPHWRIKPKVGEKPTYTRSKPQHAWAQINHYMTRHPHLTELRRRRGRGGHFVPSDPSKPGSDDFTARHSDAFFARYNRTEDEDRSILRLLPGTNREMERLLQDATLRHLHQSSQARLEQQRTLMAGLTTHPDALRMH